MTAAADLAVLALLDQVVVGGAVPAWQDAALCAQIDPDLFYPEKGGSTADAKGICRSCDVRAECLQDALDNRDEFGIWGGKSARERRTLLTPRFPKPSEEVAA